MRMALKSKKTEEEVVVQAELVSDDAPLKTEENVVEEVTETGLALRDADILNPDFNFDEKMIVAGRVATTLKKVIQTQELAVDINGKQYVTVEGWETLGTMLGCTPFVEEVKELPTDKPNKFIYEATVSIRQGDNVISRAKSIAERNGRQSDRPSVYSMATTRALGKAYRSALAWIVKMAGYEGTPEEDMPASMRRNRNGGK